MINIKKLFGLDMFVSDLDTFLMDYDKANPERSATQQQEFNTSAIISTNRDHVCDIADASASIVNRFLD